MTFSTLIVTTLVLLFLLVMGAGALFLYLYWWRMQRPVPKLEGVITAALLDQSVEVLRDKHGIPHILAQTEADLFRSLGWTHAQDRFWQMEQA